MKIACITMVKNECDIIELFLKINLRKADHIYVLDHKSTDDTSIIVNKLIADGLPITYIYYDQDDFRQADVITACVQKVAALNFFDYIIPLDADEFISSEMDSFEIRKLISACISKSEWALIPWRTYCPIVDKYYHSKSPLFDNFRMRAREPKLFHKIILGNEFAKGVYISEGNHFAFNSNFELSPIVAPLCMQHVPIRSSHQIINKAIIGSHTLAMKANRQVGEGSHWDEMADLIRLKNYVIDDKTLLNMAINYAAPIELRLNDDELDLSAPRIGNHSDDIVMLENSKINVFKSLDFYISQCVTRIRNN